MPNPLYIIILLLAVVGFLALIFLAVSYGQRYLKGPRWLLNAVVDVDDFLFDWIRRSLAPAEPELVPGLNRWQDDVPDDQQKWFRLVKVVVKTEEDREQLLLASQYIHDLYELDTSYMAVNYLAHLYTSPEMIEVVGERKEPSFDLFGDRGRKFLRSNAEYMFDLILETSERIITSRVMHSERVTFPPESVDRIMGFRASAIMAGIDVIGLSETDERPSLTTAPPPGPDPTVMPDPFNGYVVTLHEHEGGDVNTRHFASAEAIRLAFGEDEEIPTPAAFAEWMEYNGDTVGKIEDNDGKLLLDAMTKMYAAAARQYGA